MTRDRVSEVRIIDRYTGLAHLTQNMSLESNVQFISHIGIVGCSAEGAALCYRTVCSEGAIILGQHVHPEISIHTHSLSKYVECINKNSWEGVADLILSSANKLALIGANFLICPDNTIHQALSYIGDKLPLPWIHIVDVVGAQSIGCGFHRLGLIGTQWLINSNIYPQKMSRLGLDCVCPNSEECKEINRIIMDELVGGIFRQESVEYLKDIIRRMKNAGCDAVVLGCTEIPLVINDLNSSLPILDSTRLLARASLRRAMEDHKRRTQIESIP